MKRDMDLVRALLLKVEEEGSPTLRQVPEMEGVERDVVLYHVALLVEAGLLTALDASTFDGPDFMEIGMNWRSHEFLETIRDPEVWQTTKAGAAKVGSWSLGVIGELAKAAVVAKAQSLGLPIA